MNCYSCNNCICIDNISSKYGVENKNLDIQDVLKEQGVRIDDLMALRDSLMKGGLKFNDEEDEGDFEDKYVCVLFCCGPVFIFLIIYTIL